jgi:hypothetical protein
VNLVLARAAGAMYPRWSTAESAAFGRVYAAVAERVTDGAERNAGGPPGAGAGHRMPGAAESVSARREGDAR